MDWLFVEMMVITLDDHHYLDGCHKLASDYLSLPLSPL